MRCFTAAPPYPPKTRLTAPPPHRFAKGSDTSMSLESSSLDSKIPENHVLIYAWERSVELRKEGAILRGVTGQILWRYLLFRMSRKLVYKAYPPHHYPPPSSKCKALYMTSQEQKPKPQPTRIFHPMNLREQKEKVFSTNA